MMIIIIIIIIIIIFYFWPEIPFLSKFGIKKIKIACSSSNLAPSLIQYTEFDGDNYFFRFRLKVRVLGLIWFKNSKLSG